MSRGPGRVERAIVALVGDDSEAAFAVEELCEAIYRMGGWKSEQAAVRAGEFITRRGANLNWASAKQHRLAVVRAGNNIMKRGANLDWYRWSSGRRFTALAR